MPGPNEGASKMATMALLDKQEFGIGIYRGSERVARFASISAFVPPKAKSRTLPPIRSSGKLSGASWEGSEAGGGRI